MLCGHLAPPSRATLADERRLPYTLLQGPFADAMTHAGKLALLLVCPGVQSRLKFRVRAIDPDRSAPISRAENPMRNGPKPPRVVAPPVRQGRKPRDVN